MGNIPASYSGVPALASHFSGYNDIFRGVPTDKCLDSNSK